MITFTLFNNKDQEFEKIRIRKGKQFIALYDGDPFEYQFVTEDDRIKYIEYISIQFPNGEDVGPLNRHLLFDNPYANIKVPKDEDDYQDDSCFDNDYYDEEHRDSDGYDYFLDNDDEDE